MIEPGFSFAAFTIYEKHYLYDPFLFIVWNCIVLAMVDTYDWN
jgi:hypothetical protein